MQALYDQLCGQLEARVGPLVTASPPTLSHYTTGEGLKGILESGKIWATHYRYLNDFTEFDHGRQLVQAAIDEAQSASKQLITKLMLQFITVMLNQESEEMNYYIACFCETPDLLSQWRGYGGRGVAYSLNIKPVSASVGLPKLIQNPKGKTPSIILDLDYQIVKVRYIDYEPLIQSLVGLATKNVEELCEAKHPTLSFAVRDPLLDDDSLPPGKSLPTGDEMKRVADEIARLAANCLFVVLMQTFFRFKHSGFSEENEWRIVIIEDGKDTFHKKGFRLSNGILVPYVPIDFLKVNDVPLFELHSITCGPSPHPYQTSKSVRMLLDSKEFKDTTVDHSQIPLKA